MGQPSSDGVKTPWFLQLLVDPLVSNNMHMPDEIWWRELACRIPVPCVASLNEEMSRSGLPCTGKMKKGPVLLPCTL